MSRLDMEMEIVRLKDLFVQLAQDFGVRIKGEKEEIEFEDYGAADYLPALNLVKERQKARGEPQRAEVKALNPVYVPSTISNPHEAESEEVQSLVAFNRYLLKYVPQTPVYHAGVLVRRVPRSHLGYGVLGRAFPYLKLIEIASDLYGQDFREVFTHEITHIENPGSSEDEVRRMTRLRLPFDPRWH